MRKLPMVIITSLFLIGLVACSDTQDEEQVETDNDTEENEEQAETNNDVEENEEQDETDNDVEDNGSNKDEKQQDDQNKHDETTGTNDEIADYEEAEVIEDHIDIADMDVKVETDNPNKRVLLFSDNDKVMYKTIYIKEKQRLKIIDIYEDNGQIFNETI